MLLPTFWPKESFALFESSDSKSSTKANPSACRTDLKNPRLKRLNPYTVQCVIRHAALMNQRFKELLR
jgi:hypothetical protein